MEKEISITVKDPQGNIHKLDCPTDMGLNLKDVCKAYELPMEAVCGGMATCGTCQCYIIEGKENLPEKGEIEDDLLSELYNSNEKSRLACQLPVTNKMDGLFIEIAEE